MAAPVLIVSGPPGAGKTTLARRLAETADAPAVHLHTDDFFDSVRCGFIAPWLPESHRQNQVITQAIVAAASAFVSGGYQVVVDGVVGPWFVGAYRDAAQRLGVGLDYVVLRPDLTTAVARARDREVSPLADYPPGIFEAFADLGALEAHAIDSTDVSIDALMAAVRAGQAADRFRLA